MLRSTAYLDGLRGVAAWSVFNAHLPAVLVKHGGGHPGHPGGLHTQFWKFPIIRLVYKGDFAVAIFFVISGYVLSLGPIAAMNKTPRGDTGGTMARMSSAVCRRPMRLYLPSMASMALVFILIRLNYFGALQGRESEFEASVQGW